MNRNSCISSKCYMDAIFISWPVVCPLSEAGPFISRASSMS